VALSDGRPTLVEFYADWCEACQAMAPAMETIEQQHHGELDVVLLNVDNPRWQPEIDRYDVNGIPQLELFDAGGSAVGRALGARSRPEQPHRPDPRRSHPGRHHGRPPQPRLMRALRCRWVDRPSLQPTASRLAPVPHRHEPLPG
jgi:hypothetical protein